MRTPKTIYAVNRGALMNANKYWFGIDGIDCTGKTSIAHALQADSEFLRLANATVYDEFTSGASGEALRRIISEHRFLSLSNPPRTRWADTFLLMSDWAYKVETFSTSKFNTAISDRTHLSIGGYQTTRLLDQYKEISAEAVVNSITQMIRQVQNSSVNVQFVDILLLVDEQRLKDRIAIRGEEPLDGKQLATLLHAQDRHIEFGARTTIDTSEMSFGEVLNTVRNLILNRLENHA